MRPHPSRFPLTGVRPVCAALAALLAWTGHEPRAEAGQGPSAVNIRMAPGETVPACVTPGRLMAHVRERTRALDPRFADIASFYRQHGEALRVRWDYAFFQMLIETNYLSYKTGNGRWGDVDPKQNNFAGIGTTGGGIPGDSFKDVSTGVLGQIQHLVAYSGERVANPVATRTVEKQEEIIEKSLRLRRPVQFADLARRWAVDWRYARSIEYVAERYRKANCTATGAPLHPSPDPRENVPAAAIEASASQRPALEVRVAEAQAGIALLTQPAQGTAPGGTCGIWSASFGGNVALLIRSVAGATTNYTVLLVDAAAEAGQATAYMAAHAPGGETLARFDSREAAFARAFELCPRPS